MKLVGLIREIRKDNSSWSAKKIYVILMWEREGFCSPGVATIGRIIKKIQYVLSIRHTSTHKKAENGRKSCRTQEKTVQSESTSAE